MNTYTVEIQATSDGNIWQAVHPAETVKDFDGTAQELADWTAAHQNIVDGPHAWRVQVWNGADADLGSDPAAVHTQEDGHFTAWLSTDPSVLEGDTIDLTVLEDEIHGYEFDANGDEDENRPVWTSTSNEAFYIDLGIRHDDEDTDIQAAAETALRDAGWTLDGGWEATDTGYIITVSK